MKKEDPRIIRTRQNIIESFNRLIQKKNFQDISISDITKEAEINRSTFYYHFLDKYDLKDNIQREVFTKEVFNQLVLQERMDEKTIILSLEAIVNCHNNLTFQCQRSYEEFRPQLDSELRERLSQILLQILNKQYGEKEEHKLLSSYWGWGIYGVAFDCINKKIEFNEAAKRLIALIL